MDALKSANLALRFLLELAGLAALAYWGFHTGTRSLTKWGLGIGAPVAVAVVWALFVAPNATITMPDAVRIGLQVIVFGAAAFGLYVTARRSVAIGYAIVVVLNAALMAVWNQ